MVTLSINGSLTIEDIIAIARRCEPVAIEPASLAEISRRRAEVMASLQERSAAAYGYNRGFGHNVDVAVHPDQINLLQRNFIRSHACGVGPHAPIEVVRATMALRLQSLLRGYSGITTAPIERLQLFLNERVTPVVPMYGSVGASGDLSPLSHIGLALIGDGAVYDRGALTTAALAHERLGVAPLELEAKEGLALSNGSQFTNALAMLSYADLMALLQTEVISTALAVQVLFGSDGPFEKQLQELRPFRGPQIVSSWLRNLIANSPIRDVHRTFDIDGEVQDPYNLRCSPPILGTCLDLMEDARNACELEANSATDNPLVLPDDIGAFTRIVSGGHFHGMPLAVRVYGMLETCSMIASLCNARCQRYVDPHRNKGLGNVLLWPSLTPAQLQTSSGMMIPEYTSASLTNLIISASSPSHLFSISTDSGQEDHVSMGTGLAARLYETIPRVRNIVAIELAYALQAAAIRKANPVCPSKHQPPAGTLSAEREALAAQATQIMGHPFNVNVTFKVTVPLRPEECALSPVCEAIYCAAQSVFKPVVEDRVLSDDIERLSEYISTGAALVTANQYNAWAY
jgi:histidine ammonia-lyase